MRSGRGFWAQEASEPPQVHLEGPQGRLDPMPRRLLVSLVSLALALLAGELWLGAELEDGSLGKAPIPPFGHLDPTTLEELEQRAEQARTTPAFCGPLLRWSERYGWIGVPGRHEDPSLTRNSMGARGQREFPDERDPDRIRVLCFGESFTFGAEVGDGEDWPSQLEALEPRLEVWNFGVNAWGTDQALLRFRELAPLLGADVILMGFLTENACRNVNRFRQVYQPRDTPALAKPRFILEGEELVLIPLPFESEVEFLETAARGQLRDVLAEHEYWLGDDPVLAGSNIARALAARRAAKRRNPLLLLSDPEGEPYRVSSELIVTFHEEATALGARAVGTIVFHPRTDHEFYESHDADHLWSGFVSELTGRGVEVIETFEAISELREAGATGYEHVHHDPEGNGAIASLVLAHLRSTLPELR